MPPLVVFCLDELFVRQRWRPWVTGVAIGLLALVQLSVGTEVLVIVLISSAVGTVLLVAWGLFHRDLLAARAPYALRGLAWAVGASAGAARLPGLVRAGRSRPPVGRRLGERTWASATAATLLGSFVHPMAPSARVSLLTHGSAGTRRRRCPASTSDGAWWASWSSAWPSGTGYLRLWLFAAVGIVSVFLSLGLSFHGWTLWRLFVRAPLMGNIIPSRFVLVTYLCAAVMLGIICDRTSPGRRRRSVAGRIAAGVAALLVAAHRPGPDRLVLRRRAAADRHPGPVPQWFRTVAPRLPDHQVLVVFPFAFRQSNMTWQAVDRMHYAMVGGGGPDSTLSRAGKERVGQRYLADISLAGGPQPIVAGEVVAVRRALDGWGVTGVVLPDPRRLPEYEKVFLVRSIVVLVTAATGRMPGLRGRRLGVDRRGPCRPAGRPGRRTSWPGARPGRRPARCRSIEASAACILAPPAPA